MGDELEELDNQAYNSPADRIRPYMWKKGQSGNIMGRPKGKTMKEYVKDYLAKMTDEERDEWLEGIDKHKIWEMGEDKAQSHTDLTSKGEKVFNDMRDKTDEELIKLSKAST